MAGHCFFAFEPGATRRLELDVRGMDRANRVLVVRVERFYEPGGSLFCLSHCISSYGMKTDVE